jgi:type I restriction enzyme, R subunit
MRSEEKARQRIDQLLQNAGWTLQDCKELNPGASLGVAVREFPVSTGFADYLLFVDRKAAGVIEAKPEGTTLTSAEYQSDKYIFSLPKDIPSVQNPLPFSYESTGVETSFRSLKDPDTRPSAAVELTGKGFSN